MMCTTLDELIEEFQRHPLPCCGRLRLDHYLVLEPTNEALEKGLMLLEREGILPSTAGWESEDFLNVRLYQNPYRTSGAITMYGLEMRFGSRYDCLVVNEEYSMLDRNVAVLPKETLIFFRAIREELSKLQLNCSVP
jgi:hypothetical protein